MNDPDNNLARDIIHLTQRLNQALSAEIEYQANANDENRYSALAELERVGDDLDAILNDHRAD